MLFEVAYWARLNRQPYYEFEYQFLHHCNVLQFTPFHAYSEVLVFSAAYFQVSVHTISALAAETLSSCLSELQRPTYAPNTTWQNSNVRKRDFACFLTVYCDTDLRDVHSAIWIWMFLFRQIRREPPMKPSDFKLQCLYTHPSLSRLPLSLSCLDS